MGRASFALGATLFVLWLSCCGSSDDKRVVAEAGAAGAEPAGAPGEPSAGGAGGEVATSLGGAGAPPGEPAAGAGGAPSGCSAPSRGPTTIDGDVASATTWTSDGSPYVLKYLIHVRAPLVIEPCVEVLLPPGASILVRDSGSITGMGTPSQPIRFGRSGDAAWGDIYTSGLPLKLAYTTIEGGGDLGNTVPVAATMVDAQGQDGTMPTQEVLSFDHVTVKDSVSQGILLRDGAGFSADSQALTVTGNATHPVAMWTRAVGTLPSGNYTGNKLDTILLIGTNAGQQAVQEDATLHDWGVPYEVGGNGVSAAFDVGAAAPAKSPLLTIEPGVTVRFAAAGHLFVGNSLEPRGAVSALGTQQKPITFTSAAAKPAAGDWWGIYIYDTPDPRTKFDHLIVEYAGGSSQSGSGSCSYTGISNPDAAIRFMAAAPPGEIVTNSTVSDSAGHGIDRGWIGSPIDFAATNTFSRLKHCVQTLPSPVPPAFCPAVPPCDAAQ